MATDVKIRRFRIEDYDALIALWDEAHLPYKPKGRDRRDKIEKEIKHSNAVFLVAEKEGSPPSNDIGKRQSCAESQGSLVGSVFGTHDGRKGWINRLAVSPTCRKQGIGARLVKEAEKRFEDLGIEITACLIEDRNTVSSAVFERLGYKRHADITYFSKRKHPET